METIWTPGTDWGSYLFWDTSIQFDWEILVKAGIAFCVHKSDQEQIDADYGNYSTLKNIKAARNAGVLVNGTYSWFYPHVNQGYWISRYIQATEREKPDFISVDAEQVSWIDDQGVSHIPSPNQVAENLLALCEKYSSAFPELPFLLYTRPSWLTTYAYPAIPYLKWEYFMAGWPDWGSPLYNMELDRIVKGDMRQVLTYNPVTWKMINLINDGYMPPKLKPTDVVRIWQTSSRMLPVYNGKSTPATHQYDWNFFFGDVEDLLKWVKKETNSESSTGGETTSGSGGGVITPPPNEEGGEQIVANIYDKTVPLNERAWVLTINSDQRLRAGYTYSDTWVDGIILPMGGMQTVLKPDGNKVIQLGADTTFSARCKTISKTMPVLGVLNLDPGALLRDNRTSTEIEKNILTIKSDGEKELNVLSKLVLDSWHDGLYTLENVFSGKGKWLPVSAIMLKMMAVDGYPETAIIGNDWQRRVFEKIFDTIQYFIINQNAPNIPIILYCSDQPLEKLNGKTWLQYYNTGEFANSLQGRVEKLYLAIQGRNQDLLQSTSLFNNLNPIFLSAIDPTPNYIPDSFSARLLLYEFTVNKQKVVFIENINGVNTPISCSLWCQEREEMYKLLKFISSTSTTGSSTGGVEGTSGSTTGSTTSGSSSGTQGGGTSGSGANTGGGTDLTGLMNKLNEILDILKWIVEKIMSIFK